MEFLRPVEDAFLSALQGGLEATLHERVGLGVKRFAKALKKAGAQQPHSELIEAVTRSLGFTSWNALNESLTLNGHKRDARPFAQLRPVLECPLAPYQRPSPELVAHLRSMASTLAGILGMSEDRILDKAFSYVHEAKSFQELVARDPCLIGPTYEWIEDDFDASVLSRSDIGQAAIEVFWDEMSGLADHPEALLTRLRAIVGRNPGFIPAWTSLCGHLEVFGDDREATLGAYVSAADAMLQLLPEGDFLDEDVASDFNLIALNAIRYLSLHGHVEKAYDLADAMYFSTNDDEDEDAFHHWMAACACSPNISFMFFDDEIEELFSDEVEAMDRDAFLLLGMAYLASGDSEKRACGLMYVTRAVLLTGGALGFALRGDFDVAETMMQVVEDDESVDYTLTLLKIIAAVNPGIVQHVGGLLDHPRIHSAADEAAKARSDSRFEMHSLSSAEETLRYRAMIVMVSMDVAVHLDADSHGQRHGSLH